jgi:hypothetical protein
MGWHHQLLVANIASVLRNTESDASIAARPI